MKINDIRPENLMKLKEPYLEHDKDFLKDRISSFISCNCPACGSKQYSLWAIKGGFTYTKCQQCETIFMNPRADEHTLSEFYRQSKNYEFWNKYIFPATNEIRKEKIFKPRAEKIINLCKKNEITGGTIMEVGAAFGTFCETIRELNFFNRIIAVEPTPDLANTCRQKNIETIENNIEKVILPNDSVDVVVSFEVLEHLGQPATFIASASKYLRPGGLIICTCPNGQGLEMLALQENASVVDHEHINYFNPNSIKILLKNNFIETVDISTPGELDVDLLITAFKKNPKLFEKNNFLKYLISSTSFELKRNLQEFVKNNMLSSHMLIVGRKSYKNQI